MTAERSKGIAIYYSEWIYHNVKVLPDGWHFKGEPYSSSELFDKFKELHPHYFK